MLLLRKLTISMAMFNSYVTNYQRVSPIAERTKHINNRFLRWWVIRSPVNWQSIDMQNPSWTSYSLLSCLIYASLPDGKLEFFFRNKSASVFFGCTFTYIYIYIINYTVYTIHIYAYICIWHMFLPQNIHSRSSLLWLAPQLRHAALFLIHPDEVREYGTCSEISKACPKSGAWHPLAMKKHV